MVHCLPVPYRQTERMQARLRRNRQAIVEAATAEVASGGYSSVTVAAVAARASLATGSVYRHFASKDALLSEVFRQVSRRELEVMEGLASQPGTAARERLAACVEAFARRALAGPALAYAQIAEPLHRALEQERLELRRGYRDAFAKLVREGVAGGELAPQDADIVAAGLIGAIAEALVGPLSPAAGGRRRPGREALVASLVQFCLNAVHLAHPVHLEESHDADHAVAHA